MIVIVDPAVIVIGVADGYRSRCCLLHVFEECSR